jgi:hypothetical protein
MDLSSQTSSRNCMMLARFACKRVEERERERERERENFD